MSTQNSTKNLNQLIPKSELHVHLDGSVRISTLYQYGKQQNLIPKTDNTMHSTYKNSVVTENTGTLTEYLELFSFVNKIIGNNPAALKQVAEEFCFDKFNDNVRYVEVRYAPHLFAGDRIDNKGVVELITETFEKTSKYLNEKQQQEGNPNNYPEFKVKQILCGIWTCPTWLDDCINLIQNIDPTHKNLLAIDIACDFPPNWKGSQEAATYQKGYQKAKDLKIHRTIHAGECAGPETVIWAVENLNTERIGHGYELIEMKEKFFEYYDKNFRFKGQKVHFEYCPTSSLFTKSQKLETHALKYVKPKLHNVSISTDNGTMQFNTLSSEYDLVETEFGWGINDFVECNLNGLKAAFSEEVDEEYIESFRECYRKFGIKDF